MLRLLLSESRADQPGVRGAVTRGAGSVGSQLLPGDSLDQTRRNMKAGTAVWMILLPVGATGHINGLTTAADAAEIVERYKLPFHLQEIKGDRGNWLTGDNFKRAPACSRLPS